MNNIMRIFFIHIIIFKLNCKSINNFSSLGNITKIKDESGVLYKIRKLNFFNFFINNKKNIIIGAIIKYSWDVIRNFIKSIIKANFENCDIVMFVGKVPFNTIEKMKYYGVIIQYIPDEFLQGKAKINKYRFKLYLDFLKENKNKYNMVYTADVRDTIFQKDVFQFYNNYHKPFLGVFLEEKTIKEDFSNRVWAKKYCNEKNIRNNSIICSGTIIGTIDKFIEFCDVLWGMLKTNVNIEATFDQGAVNCIIYDKKIFNDCVIIKDNHGPVMTIGLTKTKKLVLDNEDNILNFDGQVAAVVHQYDRKSSIFQKMKKKFAGKVLNISSINKENNSIKKQINLNICVFLVLFAKEKNDTTEA